MVKISQKHLKRFALAALIFYILIGVYIQYKELSKFNSLPAPLYGGDYYYQLGSVIHALEGGNPFESSSMKGTIPGYLPLYSVSCGAFCKIFKLPALKCMLYFSLLVFTASLILYYFTFKSIFKYELVAVLGAVFVNNLARFPILKYTPFTYHILLPIFILLLFLTQKTSRKIFFLFLGFVYGLLSLSHAVCFTGATVILLIFFLSNFIALKGTKISFNVLEFKRALKNYILVALVAFPLMMLYWYKPIFIYHLQIKNNISQWAGTGSLHKITDQIQFLLNSIKNYLFNFKNLTTALNTLLIWLGVFTFLKIKSEERLFLKLFLIGSIVSVYSYFLTEPLFKVNLIPNYMSYFYLSSCGILFALLGAKKIIMKRFPVGHILVFLLTISVMFFSVLEFEKSISSNKWMRVGKTSIPLHYLSVQEYLLKNSNVNDVILSTKELSFVLNGLTGRKLVTNRWAQQNNPYLDFAERDVAAAIILYGNDTAEIKKLLKKYEVKYLYWDYYWINSEFHLNNGQISSIFDPLIAFNENTYKEKLDKNNVKYFEMKWWVDPSHRDERAKKYDLLIISPENYRNFSHPWSSALDPYLIEVWNFSSENGEKIAALYKIEIR